MEPYDEGTAAVDLQRLIENEIPEGRQNLESSYANLERVAAYCEANYFQAADKKAAFEETKRYTVQSLASVAYQINTLASSLLTMLDMQADKITSIESQVNNISQIVDIHKEKVARREIGVLTANKVVPRNHKIQVPPHQEKPQRYVRTAINYSVLDDLGHGVKLAHHPQQPSSSIPKLDRTGSTVSAGSSGSGSGGSSQLMFHHQQQMMMGGPSGGHIMQHIYAGGGRQQPRTPIAGGLPQHIIQQQQQLGNYSHVSMRHQPPMASEQLRVQLTAGGGADPQLPPPPSPGMMDTTDFMMSQHSPPLPPPPMDDLNPADYSATAAVIPEMPQYGTYIGAAVPDWVPPNYIEKVVAIYDYQAEKADELSFQENDVIFVVRKNEDGWFEGVMEGVTGLFPGNYVESCMS